MKRILAGSLLVVVVLIAIQIFLVSKNNNVKPFLPEGTSPAYLVKNNEVDYQAGLAIFTNSTFRVFTSPMYHNRSADVFIESSNPKVVHVKKKGITWNDFFKTLPMELTKECLTTGTKEKFCTSEKGRLSFYLNQVETPNLLDLEIKDKDRILISYGNVTKEVVNLQMQKVPAP